MSADAHFPLQLRSSAARLWEEFSGARISNATLRARARPGFEWLFLAKSVGFDLENERVGLVRGRTKSTKMVHKSPKSQSQSHPMGVGRDG
jgi:hypothetical protein